MRPLLLPFALLFAAPALAQSELEEVESETKAIQQNVQKSKSALAALQARIAGENPGVLRVVPARAEGPYRVESVDYIVDGRPLGASVAGRPVEHPVPAGPHRVAARVTLKGADGEYLSTYTFRAQASAEAQVPVDGVATLQLVIGEREGRPVVTLEASPVGEGAPSAQ